MNWPRKIFANFVEWLQPELSIIYVDELPGTVNDKAIYIVGDKSRPWLLAFQCPCGCHCLIQLNLLKDADPCWKFRLTTNNKINISPSVWRTKGCKSHFFVYKSKIEWAKSYESYKSERSKGP